MDVISDDRAEFAPHRVDQFPVYHRIVIRAVVTQVSDDRPRAEIDVISEDRVAGVTQMPDGGMAADDRIFDFDRLSDMDKITDDGIAPDVTIRTDFAVFADDDVAFDVDTR